MDDDLTASGDWMNRYRAGAATADEQRLLVEYVQSLEAWKASATTVLAKWDETWKAAGEPGPLGGSKAENVRRRIAELEDDAKYLGQRTVQMHRQAMERARDAEAERDAALADRAKLREAISAIREHADRGVAWSLHTRQTVRDLCDSALADTEEAKSDG